MKKLSVGVAIAALALPAATFAAQDHRGHRADTNGDEIVTLAEHEAEVAKHFAKLDSDGNGVVTEAEMKAMHAQRQAERAEHKAAREAKVQKRMAEATPEQRAMWEERRAERLEMRETRKDMRGERHAEMWAKSDANRDGALSLGEMQAHARDRFVKMDKNGNGQIDADERRGGKHRRHAPRG